MFKIMCEGINMLKMCCLKGVENIHLTHVFGMQFYIVTAVLLVFRWVIHTKVTVSYGITWLQWVKGEKKKKKKKKKQEWFWKY